MAAMCFNCRDSLTSKFGLLYVPDHTQMSVVVEIDTRQLIDHLASSDVLSNSPCWLVGSSRKAVEQASTGWKNWRSSKAKDGGRRLSVVVKWCWERCQSGTSLGEPFKMSRQFPAKMLPKHMPKIHQIQNRAAGKVWACHSEAKCCGMDQCRYWAVCFEQDSFCSPDTKWHHTEECVSYSTMNINSPSVCGDDFWDETWRYCCRHNSNRYRS